MAAPANLTWPLAGAEAVSHCDKLSTGALLAPAR
jgi:hypothetical protein